MWVFLKWNLKTPNKYTWCSKEIAPSTTKIAPPQENYTLSIVPKYMENLGFVAVRLTFFTCQVIKHEKNCTTNIKLCTSSMVRELKKISEYIENFRHVIVRLTFSVCPMNKYALVITIKKLTFLFWDVSPFLSDVLVPQFFLS